MATTENLLGQRQSQHLPVKSEHAGPPHGCRPMWNDEQDGWSHPLQLVNDGWQQGPRGVQPHDLVPPVCWLVEP